MDTESRIKVTQGWGFGDNVQLLFNECKASIWYDVKALKMNSGDGCTTLSVYLMPLNFTFKNNLSSTFFKIKYFKR